MKAAPSGSDGIAIVTWHQIILAINEYAVIYVAGEELANNYVKLHLVRYASNLQCFVVEAPKQEVCVHNQ